MWHNCAEDCEAEARGYPWVCIGLLKNYLGTSGAVVKLRAERVHKALERIGIPSQIIQSRRELPDRTAVMEPFKTGENGVLIATGVSAQGIDIPNVDLVMNYDLPDVPEY